MADGNKLGVAPLRTALDVTLTKDELEYVAAFVTDDATRDDEAVRLLIGDGHSGYGLYAAHPEYPEEGAILVKNMPAFQPPTYTDPNCREARMVVIERDASGKPTVWCDPEIADLIRALNCGGVRTIASCSGHGEKPGWIALKGGRQLAVVPDLDSFKRLIGADGVQGTFNDQQEADHG